MPAAIILLGIRQQDLDLRDLVHEFGWSVEVASSFDQIRRICARRQVVSVYFDPRGLGLEWQEALRGVVQSAPGALPVICQCFSDPVPVDQLTESGVFYALRLPFARHEVQQSLGFLQAALSRYSAQSEQKNTTRRSSQRAAASKAS